MHIDADQSFQSLTDEFCFSWQIVIVNSHWSHIIYIYMYLYFVSQNVSTMFSGKKLHPRSGMFPKTPINISVFEIKSDEATLKVIKFEEIVTFTRSYEKSEVNW